MNFFYVIIVFDQITNRIPNDLIFLFAEESSQDSKLQFSEDEETLITRMFNLVGERWASFN